VDRVQKVTAVVAAGISTGIGGTRSVLMSQRLAPPERPDYRGAWRRLYALLVVAAVALGLGAVFDPRAFAALRIGIPAPLVFLVPAAVALVWAVAAGARRRAWMRHERAQWEMAIARWYDLYYCGRDDGVYLPDRSELVSVELMGTLLFAPEL
jgi:hypothetical protein